MCSSKTNPHVVTHRSIVASCIAIAIGVIAPPHSVQAAHHQKQVLILYAAKRDAPIVAVADRELPRMLEASLPFRIAYYSEFIDPARFQQLEYRRAFRDFLRLKYRGVRFDLIVAMGDTPLQFFHAHRDGLFARVPVVFLARRRPPAHALRNATGVIARLKYQTAEARAVGRLASRVLRGERADTIPVAAASLNVSQVDWRQPPRGGISEGRVPPGVLVLSKTPSASGGDRAIVLGTLALLLAHAALIAGLLVQRRRHQQAEARAQRRQSELRAHYERIRDLGARLLSAQETERSQIAIELHDDIGQQLAVLTIDLQLASETGDDRVSTALARAQTIATNLHDLSDRVHPAKLRLIGLVPALKALERELSESEMAIVVSHENVPPVLPHDLTLCLFRVVQQALQNALEHSHANEVSVYVRSESPAYLALTVADDGVGFDVRADGGEGIGLTSMRERLEAVGGHLHVDSRPGTGTRVEIRVPLPPEAAIVAG
jgi:signal transduction histidine kinase